MKIAILFKTSELSGTQKRSAKIALALNQRGHQVVMFVDKATHLALTSQNYNFVWPEFVVWQYPKWVTVFDYKRKRHKELRRRLGINKLDFWARRLFWYLLFRRHRIDVVHVYLTWRICQELSIPHVFEITSPDVARRIIEFGPEFPKKTLLHPNSETVEKAMGDHFSNNRCMVAPHAYFDPNEPEGFAPPPKENLVVFGHRLVERKNPVLFARAAKRFLKLRPDWTVAIRGAGPLSEETYEILREEVQDGRALFGFEANLMDELYRSKIFVSIETEDNYSNQSVLEAMWCKNALVLSDRGRTRARYFADNGVLCEPDEISVTEALHSLAGNPERLEACAQNSRTHVETAFSREEYLDHLEVVYRTARSN